MLSPTSSNDSSDFFSPLPRSKDISWIGARQSPIFDDEQSPLLLPNTTTTKETTTPILPTLIIISTSIHFGLVVLYQAIQEPSNLDSSWKTCWIAPTTLLNLGAYTNDQNRQYYRLLTSVTLPTSIWDLLVIILAWKWVLRYTQSYTALAIVTALHQLWMVTGHTDAVVGSALSITSAMVVYRGTQQPERQSVLYLLAAIALIYVFYTLPYHSVIGTTGAYVWAMAAPRKHSTRNAFQMLITICTVVAPVVWIGVALP